MQRRDFLKSASAGAIGASCPGLLATTNAADADNFQLRYILGSSMYGKTDLEAVVGEVKRSGTDLIDIWPMGHANQREQVETMGHDKFAALLEKYNVKLGMTTRYDLGPYRLGDEMEFVQQFGGSLIVCGAKKEPGETLRDQVKAFVEKLKPHVAKAEETGVTLGIENHAGSLLNTPDSIRYFGEFAKSPKLGVALAPYHLPQDEKLLAGLIEELGPKMVHFYAWQHGMGCMKKLPKEQEMLQMPGRGDLDFTPLLAAMRKTKYAGWTEVFMHPVPRGIPILEPIRQVTDAINESREYLAKCLTTA